MGDRLFHFLEVPANAAFGGSGGMADDMTMNSGPSHTGKEVPD